MITMRKSFTVLRVALIALAVARKSEGGFLEALKAAGSKISYGPPPPTRSGNAAQAANSLGFNLLGKARGGVGQGGVVYSPLSISSAFALVYFGAQGATKSELESVFGFQQSGVPNELITKAEEFGEGANGDATIANRAYVAADVRVKPGYVNTLRGGIHIQSIDFSGNPGRSRQEINGFVGRVTREVIPELLPAGFVNSQTRFLVVNAVYFKGIWQASFPRKNTFTDEFRGVNGAQDVEYMSFNEPGSFNTRQLPSLDSHILELPYTGKRFSMFIILPNQDDGWRVVESQLQGMSYADLFEYKDISTTEVVLPKFELEMKMENLKEHIIGLGAPSVFSQDADLSGITGSERLHLTDVIHVAKIKVDEEGTQAAAATGLVSSRSFFTGNRFIVDHPFLFFVIDKNDGAVFFQGTVTSI